MAILPKSRDRVNALKIPEPFFTEINKLKIHVEAPRSQVAKSIMSKKNN